jgi:hypothetical protein
MRCQDKQGIVQVHKDRLGKVFNADLVAAYNIQHFI